MILPEFAMRCRAAVRRLGHHRTHAHHHAGAMVRHMVHHVHHSPTIAGACRWVPIAAIASFGAASPVSIVSLSNVSASPTSMARPGTAPARTAGVATGPAISPGDAVGEGWPAFGEGLPQGTRVVSPRISSRQFLLPLDSTPFELIFETLPVGAELTGDAYADTRGPELPITAAFIPPQDWPDAFLPQAALPPGQPTAAISVPEPPAALLLAGVVLALVLLRRRKKRPQPQHGHGDAA